MGGNYVGAKHTDGRENVQPNDMGRFPANIIFDEGAAQILDEQSGQLRSGAGNIRGKDTSFIDHAGGGKSGNAGDLQVSYGDIGGASRFFYCPKPSQEEKNKGLAKKGMVNTHITVKPVKLMQYLVKMVTPVGGLCLDPHNGSGTTGIACKLEGINYIGIDNDEKQCEASRIRIDGWHVHPKQLSLI